MKPWTIVVAAGSGTRFGGAKQFAPLAGRAVVDHCVDAVRAAGHGVVLVLPAGSAPTWDGVDAVVAGGASRSASVRAGLAALPDGVDVVCVHDGARPLASPALFVAVVAALDEPGVDAAVPGLAVADTVKRVADGRVVGTVDRADLVAVQTPQAFRVADLRRVHEGDPDATDDAGLIEAAGGVVAVVAGEPANRKLTTPEDLVWAEALLTDRGTGRPG